MKFFGKHKDSGNPGERGQSCLNEALACLTNDAADIQLRMKAMFIKCHEAACLFKQDLEAKKKTVPADKQQPIASSIGLATALELQLKAAEASNCWSQIENFEQKDADFNKALCRAIQTLGDAGKLIRLEGPAEICERWHRKALTLAAAALGYTDSVTLQSLFDLAVTLDVRGSNEAQSLYDRLFDRRPDYVPVANFLANLANAFVQLGKAPEAERMYERALQVREQSGAEPGDLIALLETYAEFSCACARWDKARDLYRTALSLAQRNFGSNHADTGLLMFKTAICLMNAEDFSEAVPLLEQALAIREGAPGGSLQYAREMRCLAGCYAMLERFEPAEQAFQKVFEILKMTEGVLPDELIDIGTNLAAIYCEQSKFDQVFPLIDEMLRLSERVFGLEGETSLRLQQLKEEALSLASTQEL